MKIICKDSKYSRAVISSEQSAISFFKGKYEIYSNLDNQPQRGNVLKRFICPIITIMFN
jgi:hypothetical protein